MRICFNTTACSPHQNPQFKLTILRNALLEQHECQCGKPEKGYRQIGMNQRVGDGFSLRKLRYTSSLPAQWQGFSK